MSLVLVIDIITRQKYHFGPHILEPQSIWSLHFCNSQFGLHYFQLRVNSAPTINPLTKNAYMVNGVLC